MPLTVNDMPGPSLAAKELQLKQDQLRAAIYREMQDQNKGEPDSPGLIAARAAYNASVAELEKLLGADAPCWCVDCDMWSEFSDWFKEEHGIRPRGMHFTRAEVERRLVE